MINSIQAIAALIALTGVLVSTLVSLIISRRKIDLDVRLARLGIQSRYANLLCEKRLNHYPSLYQAIQDLTQAIQGRVATFELLEGVHTTVRTWFSKHSILLGVRATDKAYTYERFLRRLVIKGEDAFNKRLDSPKQRRNLIRRSWAVCLALKNDLGVFEVEFAEPGMVLESYKDAEELFEGDG